jgi:hypothetical protein
MGLLPPGASKPKAIGAGEVIVDAHFEDAPRDKK